MPSLASSRIGYESIMQMRCGFRHVEIGRGTLSYVRIAPRKSCIYFIQVIFRRKLSVLCLCPHIVLVAYLQNNLMNASPVCRTDFLIVIINYAVFLVASHGIRVSASSNNSWYTSLIIFVAVFHIQTTPLRVSSVLCMEFFCCYD